MRGYVIAHVCLRIGVCGYHLLSSLETGHVLFHDMDLPMLYAGA